MSTQQQKKVGFMRQIKQLCKVCFAYILFAPLLISAQTTGPSSSQSPYLLPIASGVNTTSILTANDSIIGYPMVGVPDGLGAFDNGDGTFTLLMNHELLTTQGRERAHGQKGSFVSKWIIRKSDFTVLSGMDLMKNVKLWTGTGYDTYNPCNPSPLAAFNRFCSGDLPAVTAFYNASSGLGTQVRIYMNGEESGTEGRAMGHIITGSNIGTSYELPYLGKFAWENSVASPHAQDKTIVAGMDDGTGGQVYFYIGTKTNTGSDIDKAGLSNGNLYGVVVSGFPIERVNTTTINPPPAPGTRFSLADLGQVSNVSGLTLNTNSVTAGVTTFSRPEDGSWDPSNSTDFYFNTTDQIDQVNDGVGTQIGRSRLWHLHFDDIEHPESGGTIEAVLDGTEGQNMLDNMTIDHYGHIILQEDVGNSAHNGKIWLYNIATDAFTQIAKHDPARFGDIGLSATPPFTQDEESSGIIDAQEILGSGMFLFDDQAHYTTGIPLDIVEGGQFLAMYIPGLCSVPAVPGNIKGEKNNLCAGGTYTYYVKTVEGATSYRYTVPSDFTVVSTSASGDTITLTIPAGIVQDTLKVTANNSCGSSEPQIIVLRGRPSKPGISGPNCVSSNASGLVYSITTTEPNVTYTWKVTKGAFITAGQGTPQVTVTWGSASGKISVLASNNCGSNTTSYKVTVNCSKDMSKASLSASDNFSVTAFPNPTTGKLNVEFIVASSDKYAIEIFDVNGKSIQRKEIVVQHGKNNLTLDLKGVSKGNYLLTVTGGSNTATKKILVTQ